MIKKISLCLLIVFGLSISLGFASQESFLQWRQVRIVSDDYPETGVVTFDAKIEEGINKYKKVSIQVFGTTYDLPEEDLIKLRGFPLNSLVVTHEPGYEVIGGHTVHFKMKSAYYKSRELIEEQIRISISKGKGLEIHGPSRVGKIQVIPR